MCARMALWCALQEGTPPVGPALAVPRAPDTQNALHQCWCRA